VILNRVEALLEPRNAGPVFGYIHVIYPHMPFDPPPPYDNQFGRGVFSFSEDDSHLKDRIVNMYDGEIRRADEFVFGFLQQLQESEMDENSVIVLLSDHGEGFWEHGLVEHGNSLYNELLHIPLIIWAPGRIPAGSTVPELVRLVDVMPTLLELAGIENDGVYRGRSLLPLLGMGEDGQRLAYSEAPHSVMVRGKALQSVTEKYIRTNVDGPSPEYYDLSSDPEEHQDLSDRGRPEMKKMDLLVEEISDSARLRRESFSSEVSEPSKELLEKLKTLGYIQ
jgi:arylsulfatase A-like enzyme